MADAWLEDELYGDLDEEDEDEGAVGGRPRRMRVVRELDLRTDHEVTERFRMSQESMRYLEDRLGPLLSRQTLRNTSLSVREQIEIALRFLGSGVQYHYVGEMAGVDKSVVCRVVQAFVSAVNDTLFREVVCWPTQNVNQIEEGFRQLAGIPNVCGCIDGTLVNIDAPTQNEAGFVDRHGNHSINCLLVCGPDFKFYYANADWPGSVHDARVWRTCSLFNRMRAGWRPFANAILLGDSAYPLLPYLITPVTRNFQGPSAERFLRAHKSTRRIIENAIGILKEKFPCLNHLRVDVPFACQIIYCCVTLCNLSRTNVCQLPPLGEVAEAEDVDAPEEEPAAEQDPAEAVAVLGELIGRFR